MHDVAGRLPSGLIAELMGIARSDGERLYELTEIMHTTDDAVAPPEVKLAAISEMLGFAAEVAERKRSEPGDDIASTLVQAEVDGDRLTDGEFQWFFLLLVNAGGDTTRNLLASGIQLLFDHPDERARLIGGSRRLLPTAIEEMLRYTSPVVNFRRTALEDTVLRDQPIAAGDKLMVFYGSANRDEDVFVDPDRFDVGRAPNPHMAFGGGGPHLCLGLHVARIEIAAMLRELLTRMPDLAPAGAPEHLASNFIAGVRTMPVSFTPGARWAEPGEAPSDGCFGAAAETIRDAARSLITATSASACAACEALGRPQHSMGERWSAEGGDHRGEGLDLGGRAVEVEGDDGLLDAGLGPLAVAADVLLDRADDGRVALGRAR